MIEKTKCYCHRTEEDEAKQNIIIIKSLFIVKNNISGLLSIGGMNLRTYIRGKIVFLPLNTNGLEHI